MCRSIVKRWSLALANLSTLMVAIWASSAWALDSASADPINSLPNNPPAYIEILKQAGHEEAAAEFAKAVEFERQDKMADSIPILNKLHEQFPNAPYIMWRQSRNYWVYAENLDINDKENRLKNFEIGLDWANKGLAANENCSECYLFKFGNWGRISTTKGLVNSISAAKGLSETIAKAIEIGTDHQDTEFNASLPNAYYASGVFYRIIPDWMIVRWVAGVRGDKMKSLKHIKKAADMMPMRVDFQVELGAIYLCLAEEKGKEEMREPGIQALKRAIDMKQVMPTDPLDKDYARGFLKDPSGACGFSRDGIVELDKDKIEKQKG